MKLEVGKRYVDGRGEVRGPMNRLSGVGRWQFTCPWSGEWYTGAGVWSANGVADPMDLVAEYVEPLPVPEYPVLPPPIQFIPKDEPAWGASKCGVIQPTPADMVREFHERFDLLRDNGQRSRGEIELCLRMFFEEALELAKAAGYFVRVAGSGEGVVLSRHGRRFNPAEVHKELADVEYTVRAFAVRLHVDLDRALSEVHASNMTKLGEDGKPVTRADGKVLKSALYKAPDMSWAK